MAFYYAFPYVEEELPKCRHFHACWDTYKHIMRVGKWVQTNPNTPWVEWVIELPDDHEWLTFETLKGRPLVKFDVELSDLCSSLIIRPIKLTEEQSNLLNKYLDSLT